ncbi:UPF0182 family membrane protein [Dactylosporangium sp. CA-139066]|uniref:UPF0182 family membrane protein n=1 Tax=Dactylosporangium sp. CA-139066 TaxID=3239930 RepID=UPI003D8FEACB
MRNPMTRVSRRGRVTIAVLVVVFLLFTLFDRVVGAWADYLWFSEVKYPQVFTEVLQTRIWMFLIFGVAVGLVIAGNLYLAYRTRPLLRPHSAEQHALDRYRLFLLPHMTGWIILVAGLIGLFSGLSAQGHWQDWMLFSNSTPFGKTDPQFHVDLSFYVFEYPFWRYLLGVAFTAVVFSLIGALALHYLFGGVRLQGAGERMTAAARAHLTALVALFVLLKAAAYFLDRRGLLLDKFPTQDLYGAGYTNINALLPAKEILAWISIIVAIAIIVFSNAFMRNLVWPGLALGLLALSAVAVGGIYPAAVQSFTVKPSQLQKEAKYFQYAIDATRDAYGLNNVTVEPYSADNTKPPASSLLDGKDATVNNIRLLDPAVVGDTYTQQQQVRGFYEFNPKLDIDRYTIDGKTQDYIVGVREIRYDQLQQNNWQNRHSVYTHGYGFVAAPANQVVCSGQPLYVSGFFGDTAQPTDPNKQSGSCVADKDKIPVTHPQIYYGEQMGDVYAIVGKSKPGDRDAEFNVPTGGEDQSSTYSTYDGSGGVAVNNFWRKLLFASYFRETNFLLSGVLNDHSKVLYNRDPETRVRDIAPFLTLDSDPYPAVVDGKILWIIDGYTTSATYPYAQKLDWNTAIQDSSTSGRVFPEPRQDVNYLRNSVKATVDAYTGEVKLYAFDDQDPVLKTWNKAFGGKLVQPRSAISPGLMDHLRYPEDQFKVQRDLLSRFHVTTPDGFFSGQDFWEVPKDPANPTADQPPYYIVAQLPKQDSARFQLTAAMAPRKRGNLAALMSASYVNGQPRFEVLELPANTPIQGPNQTHASMTSLVDARKDLTQFASSNSDVIYGNLLSLPVANGMLYVEPIYLKNKNDKAFPRMQKVLVAYGSEYMAYADNLADGLAQLVKQVTGQAPPPQTDNGGTQGNQPTTGNQPSTPQVQEAIAAMNKAIADLKAAQQSGDFEAYGKALKALQDAIGQYENAVKAAGASPSTGASPGPTTTASTNPSPTVQPSSAG